MIIQTQDIVKIGSIEIQDMTSALAEYRLFKNSDSITMGSFIKFLAVASDDRTIFLKRMDKEISLVNGTFAKQIYCVK